LLRVLALFGVTGCVTPEVLGACETHSDCDGGKVCLNNACASLCAVQSDCPSGSVCGVAGHCESRRDGPSPEITSVRDSDTVPGAAGSARGLLVTGTNLAAARFELRSDAAPASLALAYRLDASAELYLPEEIRSGTYTLVATNLAGEDQQAFTLHLPEQPDQPSLQPPVTSPAEGLSLGALPAALSGPHAGSNHEP
jgi:hypothetical protein